MTSLPFQVFVSDMDGTLLSPESVVTAYTKSILRRISQMGVHVFLATGRHYADVAIILNNLELPRPGYLITSNGACIHTTGANHSGGGLEVVLERSLDPEVVSDLLQILPVEEEEINTNYFQGEAWKCKLDWQDQLEYHKESGFRYTTVDPHAVAEEYNKWRQRNSPIDVNPLSRVAKMAFGSDNVERLHELERRVLERHAASVETAFSSRYCLDVCAKGVTKWTAVEHLLSTLNNNNKNSNNISTASTLDAKQCIAFGDGMNDLHMLQEAGKSCIVRNGNERLKEALPSVEVIASNAEDGVAKKLAEVFAL